MISHTITTDIPLVAAEITPVEGLLHVQLESRSDGLLKWGGHYAWEFESEEQRAEAWQKLLRYASENKTVKTAVGNLWITGAANKLGLRIEATYRGIGAANLSSADAHVQTRRW